MSSVPRLLSAELEGITGEPVYVEADVNVGLHSFTIVGLADKAVSEAKERVNSALKNAGVKPPTKENRRITINLAPADLKKAGSRFDLPIALAYLMATGQMKPFPAADKLFVGELSLDGTLRPVTGVINIARLAKRLRVAELFVPRENADEAALMAGVKIIPVGHIRDAIHHLEGIAPIRPAAAGVLAGVHAHSKTSIDDVRGQENAKRALLIAAAGGHNILFSGPPGAGKTMLAEAFASLLPPPSENEILEIMEVWSAAGEKFERYARPFRSPHHTASPSAILGGGTNPRPGEISLAHRGVLFLDELPEFRRDVLEGLRQPLENGTVCVARSKKSLEFPARFIFVAAMNPCPCGFFGDKEKECRCTAYEVLKYQKRVSGPLLDRIDLQLFVPRVPYEALAEKRENREMKLRDRIFRAREFQQTRLRSLGISGESNAEIGAKDIEAIAELEPAGEAFLKSAMEKSFVSPRSYHKILKVARTIADLDGAETIGTPHLAEAFHYRLRAGEV